MTKNFIQLGILVVASLLLILEKGLFGTFVLFNLFQPSLIILVVLINLKSKNTFLIIFFIYGMLIDLLNHNFIGITSLIYTISLYLFYVFSIRFNQNKIFIGLLNLVFIVILSAGYHGFQNYQYWEVYASTIIVFLASSLSWIRR